MSDDVIEQAAGVLVLHQRFSIDGCSCGWDDLGKSYSRHLAQALADAGLLPTEVEWGVRDEETGQVDTFASRDLAEAELATIRANFPWPEEIALVSRRTTPWKDAP